jgi:hybrid cluster-associated redox disulfide protein
METPLTENTTVKELLERHPHLLQAFIDLGMRCVGCPADAFHNLADVANEYGFDKEEFIGRLKSAIHDVTTGETKT